MSQERLEALRRKKRLTELRAKRDARADTNLITSPTQPFEGETGGTGEAVLSIGTGLASSTGAGLVGAAQAPFIGAEQAAQNIESIQEAGTFVPRTEEGQKRVQQFGKLMQEFGKFVSLPVVGLEGAATALSTGSIKEANTAMAKMLDEGVSQRLGDRNLEATGSPLVATAASLTPDALLAPLGVRGAQAASKSIVRLRQASDKPELRVFDESGKFTDEAIAELEKLQTDKSALAGEIIDEAGKDGAVLTVEQAKRLNLFTERGVPAIRADITRGTQDSIDQQQAIKEGGPVAAVAAEQDKALISNVEKGIEGTGGIATDAESASASVQNVITKVGTDLDNKVIAAYEAANKVAQGAPVLNLQGFIDIVRQNKGREKITGGVLTSIRQTLKNRGLAGKDADPVTTVKIAEEIRQELNADFPSATPRGRMLIRELKDALDTDVEQAVGADIFADARQAKIRFHNALERAARNKFDQSKGSLVEDILINKVPEEKIIEKILSPSTRTDDIKKLKQFLTEDFKDFGGVQAWNDVRAQALRGALDKAISTAQIKEGGQATFNVRLFRNELRKLRGEKFNTLFSPDEKQLIADIEELGFARIPISGTFSGEGPTSIAVKAAVRDARRELVKRIPIIGDGAQGLIDSVVNRGRDQRLLEFTGDTEKALRK